MSCCVPTDIWRDKALLQLDSLEPELTENLRPYILHLNSPTAQQRILLQAFLDENPQDLKTWLKAPSDGSKTVQIPPYYQRLISEIMDNYLNSNN